MRLLLLFALLLVACRTDRDKTPTGVDADTDTDTDADTDADPDADAPQPGDALCAAGGPITGDGLSGVTCLSPLDGAAGHTASDGRLTWKPGPIGRIYR